MWIPHLSVTNEIAAAPDHSSNNGDYECLWHCRRSRCAGCKRSQRRLIWLCSRTWSLLSLRKLKGIVMDPRICVAWSPNTTTLLCLWQGKHEYANFLHLNYVNFDHLPSTTHVINKHPLHIDCEVWNWHTLLDPTFLLPSCEMTT